jgi:hypothetical protein
MTLLTVSQAEDELHYGVHIKVLATESAVR